MTDPRILTAARVEDDAQDEGLRPKRLNDYIGQDRIREQMQVAIEAAKQRGEALDHTLLYGPPGLGKTTLAYVIANDPRRRCARADPRGYESLVREGR